MTEPPSEDDAPDDQRTFWAGPGLVSDGEHDREPPMAVLLLWQQPPPGRDAPDRSDRIPDLLDRGFARLPDPTLEQLRRLPLLPDTCVRLSGDHHDLRIDHRGETWAAADLESASNDWWTTVQQGRFALLIDIAPVPDQAEPAIDRTPHHDLSEWAAQRMIDACRAEAVVGARVEVARD